MNRPLLLVTLSTLLLAAPARAGDDPGAEGMRLAVAGKNKEALAPLREATRRAPTDILTHKIYQQSMENLGRWKELAAEYKENISSHPLDGLAYYLYSSAVYETDELEAERALRVGLKADPKSALLTETLRLLEASDLAAAGKPDEALALIGPTSSYSFPYDAIGARVFALGALGRTDEADSLLRQVLAAVPTDPGLYLSLGNTASDQGKFAAALALYQKAHELRPSAATLNASGSMLELLGRRPEANKRYEAALTARVETAGDYLALGYAAAVLGKVDVAARAAEELEKRTKSVPMRLALTQLRFLFSDAPENLTELKRLRELYPDNQTLLSVDSSYRTSHGDCPGAAPLFERLIKDSPQSYAAYQGKAYCDRIMGHPEEALKTLEKGLAIAPKYYEFYRLQGEAYAELKEHEKAVQSYRRGLALDPKDGYTSYSLCISLTVLKRKAEAAAACRVALKYAYDDAARKQAQDGLCTVLGSCVPPPAEREAAAEEIAVKYLPDTSARFKAWKAEGQGYTVHAEEVSAQGLAERLEVVNGYPNKESYPTLIELLKTAKPGEVWAVTIRPNGKIDQDIDCLVDLKKNWLAEISEHQIGEREPVEHAP